MLIKVLEQDKEYVERFPRSGRGGRLPKNEVKSAMSDVEEILSTHGLTKETAIKFIDAMLQFNQTETAHQMEVTRTTVNRYKKAFQKMTEEERAFLISMLYQERHRALVNGTK